MNDGMRLFVFHVSFNSPITESPIVNLDVMMAKRKMSLTELAGEVDIIFANLSILKNNRAKAVRFAALEAICSALRRQPGGYLGVCGRSGGWRGGCTYAMYAREGFFQLLAVSFLNLVIVLVTMQYAILQREWHR